MAVDTADVVIVLKEPAKVTVASSADDVAATFALITPNDTGSLTKRISQSISTFKATGTGGAAATFTLDYAPTFSGYIFGGGTEEIHAGTLATVTIYGVRLKGVNLGEKFEFAAQDSLAGVTQYLTTAPLYGSGTKTEVRESEKEANRMSRIYNYPAGAFVEDVATNVVDDMYDLVTITHLNTRNNAGAGSSTVNFTRHLQIAMPSANRGVSTFPSESLFDTTSGYINGTGGIAVSVGLPAITGV
jgi:hypothetical protein